MTGFIEAITMMLTNIGQAMIWLALLPLKIGNALFGFTTGSDLPTSSIIFGILFCIISWFLIGFIGYRVVNKLKALKESRKSRTPIGDSEKQALAAKTVQDEPTKGLDVTRSPWDAVRERVRRKLSEARAARRATRGEYGTMTSAGQSLQTSPDVASLFALQGSTLQSSPLDVPPPPYGFNGPVAGPQPALHGYPMPAFRYVSPDTFLARDSFASRHPMTAVDSTMFNAPVYDPEIRHVEEFRINRELARCQPVSDRGSDRALVRKQALDNNSRVRDTSSIEPLSPPESTKARLARLRVAKHSRKASEVHTHSAARCSDQSVISCQVTPTGALAAPNVPVTVERPVAAVPKKSNTGQISPRTTAAHSNPDEARLDGKPWGGRRVTWEELRAGPRYSAPHPKDAAPRSRHEDAAQLAAIDPFLSIKRAEAKAFMEERAKKSQD